MKDFKDFYKCSRRDGLENTLRLFYGSYYGIVVENDDPKQVGRVKVKVPQITDDQVIDVWARPKTYAGTDAGFFAVPSIGDGVWVEFEFGNPRYPVYNGGWWAAPEGEEAESPDEVRGDDYPNVSIWKSAGGNFLLFNDLRETVRLENTEGAFVELSDNLVKLYGESEPAVLGDKNAGVHSSHIAELQNVISQLNTLIIALNTTFAAQGVAAPVLAPAATAFATATQPITAQLAVINGQLSVLSAQDVPQTLSQKVKLD